MVAAVSDLLSAGIEVTVVSGTKKAFLRQELPCFGQTGKEQKDGPLKQ